jgi:REP-associated tyrosine transposase
MARPLRVNLPGLTYHVWANAIAGARLFRDAHDKDVALRLLREEVELNKWTCLMYVLMSTHYHLLLRLREPTLSSGFLRFNLRYARYYNDRHGTRGHVFDGRFESKIVDGRDGELEVARYLAFNPVKANMCDVPQDYPWSAYGSLIGLFPRDRIVDSRAALAPVGGSSRAYRTYMEEPDPRKRWGQVCARPQKARPATATTRKGTRGGRG